MIALLPLTFLIYNITSLFSGSDKEQTHVVRDSINTSLPEADEQAMDGKLATMDKADWSGDSYTGVDRLGEEEKRMKRSLKATQKVSSIKLTNAIRKKRVLQKRRQRWSVH